MGQDLFTHVPPEIIIDILSRLPVRTAKSCKCVCRSWFSLVETPEFVNSYKSFPSLAVFQGKTSSKPYKIYQLSVEDELHLKNSKNFGKEALNFDFPLPLPICSSANGLLFLCDYFEVRPRDLFIYNPVSREYIKLPSPQSAAMSKGRLQHASCGFGVSKTSGQYKLEFQMMELKYTLLEQDYGEALMLLVVAQWRGVYKCWLAYSKGRRPWIVSCFDLESELFTTLFPPPNLDDRTSSSYFRVLFAFRDTLCFCDSTPEHEVVMWLMKEYGDDKSWTKQYVIPKIETLCWFGSLYVIKVFKNGDILLKNSGSSKMFCYSDESKTIQEKYLMERDAFNSTSAVCFTPTFLQLKIFFPMENVCSF